MFFQVKACQTFTIEKNWRSQNFDFLWKKICRNALAFKSKMVQCIFGKRLFWHYRLQLSLKHLQNCVSDFFWGNEIDFTNIMKASPISWLKIKNSKKETRFCRWKSNDYNDINIFQSLKNPYTFLITKEKIWKGIFNTNRALSQNLAEKQVIQFKTTVNWLFNDIGCYLATDNFDGKIGIFQRTVIGLLYP